MSKSLIAVDQVVFLGLISIAFSASVLVHGLLKMRIYTMTDVLSERMLRRLRYALISGMMRFPKPYFQRTSQGELVAMITSETEPMGGMMSEALWQSVLQAGQMLTILVFLFLQSFCFDHITKIHEGAASRKMKERGDRIEAKTEWQHIDQGRSRAKANVLIREINSMKEVENEQAKRADNRLGRPHDQDRAERGDRRENVRAHSIRTGRGPGNSTPPFA